MKTRYYHYVILLMALAFLALLSSSAMAASPSDCPEDIGPVTVSDPEIPVDELELRLKPLTRCELEAEAAAWLDRLKAKVTEISNAEIAVKYKNLEQATQDAVEETVEEVEEAQETSISEDSESAEDAREEVEEAKEEAQEAIEEEKQAQEKTRKDKSVQEAIEAAQDKAVSEIGEEVAESLASDHAEMKTALLELVNELIAGRTAIIDRFNTVLSEYEAKGGDTKDYDLYITAVSGIKVDVTDASATWTTLTGWLLSPEGGVRWAFNLAEFLAIIAGFYLLSILIGKAVTKATRRSRNLSSLLSAFLNTGARRVVLFIGLFVGLSSLEINVGPVLAIIGAAGFVVAFALQNSLSNFASGLLMLIYRPFDVGDVVEVGGITGTVESMNLLSTQLRLFDNKQVIVPNNSVWGDVITNITGITERRVDLIFGIGYDDDIDKAQGILEKLVNEHERVLKSPEAVIRLHELGDSSVNFICRPWVRPDDYWTVYWDITRAVKQSFDEAGISIPFPQRDVHIYQQDKSGPE